MNSSQSVKELFNEVCIIDVTNFAAQTPEDDLGYLSGGYCHLYSDGTIRVTFDGYPPEEFNISELLTVRDPQNPMFRPDLIFMTESRSVRLSFHKDETKDLFLKLIYRY